MSEQKQEQDDGGTVSNLAEALSAVGENIQLSDPQLLEKGVPVFMAVIVLFPDGTMQHWNAGPLQGNNGLYLQLLGRAGVDAAMAMGVPAGEKQEEEKRIITPPNSIVLAH